MKRTIVAILILLSSNVISKGQYNEKMRFTVAVPDVTTKLFFTENPNIEHVLISYRNDKAISLQIFSFSDSTKAKSTFLKLFNMYFEGDVYLFNRDYPHLNLPKSANLSVKSVVGIEKIIDSNSYFELSTIIKRDSTFYDFTFYTFKGKIYDGPINIGGRAAFIGNSSLLQKKLADAYRTWKPDIVPDSALFLTGIVEKNGALTELAVKDGNVTNYAERVVELIGKEATSWSPGIHSGRKVRYKVTIFVRLHKDGTITFSAL